MVCIFKSKLQTKRTAKLTSIGNYSSLVLSVCYSICALLWCYGWVTIREQKFVVWSRFCRLFTLGYSYYRVFSPSVFSCYIPRLYFVTHPPSLIRDNYPLPTLRLRHKKTHNNASIHVGKLHSWHMRHCLDIFRATNKK